MGTKPFKLINRTESQHLCDRLSERAARWATEWLAGELDRPELTAMDKTDGHTLSGFRWVARRSTDGVAAAIGMAPNDESLPQRLTGMADRASSSANDTLLRELERSAIGGLLESLLGPIDGQDIDIPQQQEYAAPGSGYVLVRCRFADALQLTLLLWPKTVAAWLGERTPKPAQRRVAVSRLDALDKQTVTIEVVAGEAEIAFDELRSLCQGFVIKLDRRLDQPLQVRLLGDGVVCSGHLGLTNERRAVQVVTTG